MSGYRREEALPVDILESVGQPTYCDGVAMADISAGGMVRVALFAEQQSTTWPDQRLERVVVSRLVMTRSALRALIDRLEPLADDAPPDVPEWAANRVGGSA